MNEEATARLKHGKKQKASIILKSTNLPRSKQVPWPGLKSMKSEGFYAPMQEGMKIWAKPSFGPPQEHVLILVWGSFSTMRGTTVRSHCMASTVLSYPGKCWGKHLKITWRAAPAVKGEAQLCFRGSHSQWRQETYRGKSSFHLFLQQSFWAKGRCMRSSCALKCRF